MAQCIQCGRRISGITFGRKICVWCKQHEAAQRGEEVKFRPMAAPWQRSGAMPMIVTQLIFGINIAVFIGMTLSGASPLGPSGQTLLDWGANFGPYTLGTQPWRLLTSVFVHIGFLHLAFNLWCLWSLGEMAETLYGHTTFACIYLLCGVSGSLASLWWHSYPTLSAGASGAIFGLAGAVIASMKLGAVRSVGFCPRTMQSLVAFVGYNVAFGLISGTIDNAAHFGGLVAGVVLGGLMAKIAPERRAAPRLVILVLVAALLAGGFFALRRSYPYRLMHSVGQINDGAGDEGEGQ